MLIAAFVDYRFISRFYIIIYVVNIALLVLVLVLFFIFGDSNGTARWIRLPGFSLQPSEFCKVFMIVFLAKYIEKNEEGLNKPLMLLLTLVLIFLPVGLIIRQPSLSAALVVGTLSLGILYVGKLSYKYILPVLALTVPLFIVAIVDLSRDTPVIITRFLRTYQIDRVMLWVKPDISNDRYFQTMQSIRAIGSGLLDGKGLTKGDTVVPYAHNDFVFAVIGEELGFIGCMAVLFCFLMIVLKCLFIAYKAVDANGRLVASGVGIMLAFQTFVHVGVATGVLPNTGTPLPFISYGGSSMWVSMASVGLCINVGMTKTKSFF
jgi:rod shape determining protein RodA